MLKITFESQTERGGESRRVTVQTNKRIRIYSPGLWVLLLWSWVGINRKFCVFAGDERQQWLQWNKCSHVYYSNNCIKVLHKPKKEAANISRLNNAHSAGERRSWRLFGMQLTCPPILRLIAISLFVVIVSLHGSHVPLALLFLWISDCERKPWRKD